MRRLLTLLAMAGLVGLLAVPALAGTGAQGNPQVGQAAPAFRLQDQNGHWRSPADYHGHWLVLYFYPKDFTPGCTTEVCTFRDEVAKLRQAGADVVGVDWRTPLDVASARIGDRYAVQGNLDPAVLFAPWPAIETEVRRIVREGSAAPGHVFNLGHGVLPQTDPDVITRVVELVHSLPPPA